MNRKTKEGYERNEKRKRKRKEVETCQKNNSSQILVKIKVTAKECEEGWNGKGEFDERERGREIKRRLQSRN